MMTICSDNLYEYIDNYKNDIIDALKDNDIKVNDDNIAAEAQTWIDNDIDYLKENLINFDNKNDSKIYIDASLGLWYGRRSGHKVVNNLYDIIFKLCQDVNALYFMRSNSTLTLKAIHHDGVNYFKFYKLVNGHKKAITYSDIVQ